MNPFYQKINAPSREVLELVLKIAAKLKTIPQPSRRSYAPPMMRPKNASI